jgi:ATP-dependent Clp protease protease subunit
MHPVIFEKTRDGETVYDIYSRLVKDRILFLNEAVNTDVATTLSATMLFLDSQKSKDPISIYINCTGGLIEAGLFTIYDTMQYIHSEIKTVCIGEAYSAASAILMSGAKGKRLAFPNATIMIHNVQAGTCGFSHAIEKDAARIKSINDRIVQMYVKHTGQKEKIIRDVMKEETYFTAAEALKFGLIDKIVEPKSF